LRGRQGETFSSCRWIWGLLQSVIPVGCIRGFVVHIALADYGTTDIYTGEMTLTKRSHELTVPVRRKAYSIKLLFASEVETRYTDCAVGDILLYYVDHAFRRIRYQKFINLYNKIEKLYFSFSASGLAEATSVCMTLQRLKFPCIERYIGLLSREFR
jgi:hypothetical protein